MLNNMSIKMKVLVLSLLAIVLVSIVVASNTIYSINKLSNESIENFKKDAYAKKEEELKNYVSLAMKTVDSFYQRTSKERVKVEVQSYLKEQTGFIMSIIEGEYAKYNGKISTEELKNRIKNIVSSTRYGQSGYFWINDTDAVIVMHPIKPQLDGKNLYNFKDQNGKQIFKEFASVALKSKEGYVDYVWPKPGFEKAQDKVSFVKLFKPFNWVIGTGEYVDNITQKLQAEAIKTISEMRYGKDGYFWINDSKPVMIMHPMKPALDGKDLSKVKDPNGKFLFNEMVKITQKNPAGGLVEYMWSKPGKETPQPKFSYVQNFGPWDWIIGTGEYVDNIEEEILLMQANTKSQIHEIISLILIITLVSLAALYFIITFLVKRVISNPLEELDNGIQYLISHTQEGNKGIQKTYDDEIGKIIDSFNGYLDLLRGNAQKDEEVIKEVEEVISKVNNGFYEYRVHTQSKNPLVEELRISINSMIEKAHTNLSQINANLVEYVKSNYNIKRSSQEDNSGGIIGSISKSSVLVGHNISEFLCMINEAGDKLNEDTTILSSSATNLSTSANEQAASLEETAASIEQITSNIKHNTENMNKMSLLADDLNHSSVTGKSLATKTTQAMQDIDTQVNSINDAITVIDQIAFQTNILSLNAAVEAATAGEAGKGFAVVAAEVRNLATRSAEAAKEIKKIVENATNKANEGKVIADDMIAGYATLSEKITQTIDLISDVSAASKEQETGIIQINDTVSVLDRATQLNASSASEINRLSNEVKVMAENLLNISNKATYDKSRNNQTCDVDLVFKIASLKNDHIIFKNTNFAKLSEKGITDWKVTDHHSCNLGKWIDEQESHAMPFTKSSKWVSLKEAHKAVHENVQRYIDDNAQEKDGAQLLEVSNDLEASMSLVFELLDEIKIFNCSLKQKNAQSAELKTVAKKEEIKPLPDVKKQPAVEEKREAEVSAKKPKIIQSQTKDDNEWESF
ncbi:MAG: cache domain-containing protein [Candidatus Marinarcus sp.]|uniref:methyl-accepting chemotaxis protein n=1 Tax=Candidatus Marinarcus sp. TaxID=3100987 RepID=UPI003B006693